MKTRLTTILMCILTGACFTSLLITNTESYKAYLLLILIVICYKFIRDDNTTRS